MTRELRNYAKNRIEYLIKISPFVFDERDREALEMAIQALSQEPTVQDKQAESEKYQKAFEDGYANGYAQARFDYKQEPCDDAISRILKRMWNCRGKHTTSIDKVAMEQIIHDELPSVTHKSGKWINDKNDIPICSRCGYIPQYDRAIDDYEYSNYCPNCGAKMESEEQTE